MAKGDGKFWVATVEKASKQIVNAINAKREIVYVSKRWKLIAIMFQLMHR
jgi:short-subunit dehydrogenase